MTTKVTVDMIAWDKAITTGFDFTAENINANAGLDVTGNITVTGTVDGRDIAADGATLDILAAGTGTPEDELFFYGSF